MKAKRALSKGKKMMTKAKRTISKSKNAVKSLYLAANNVLFEKLPTSVGTPLAAALIVAPILLAIISYYAGQAKHPSNYTVMVTNLQGTSGGSGVIISNSPSQSVVLTNNHVCEGALKKGGKIRLVSGEEHIVTGYVPDSEHDLCVLSVASDLKNSIKIAKSAPSLYAPATITGHPALMPNVITNGHFGGRQIISIMVGVRRCTEKDLKDPQMGPFCMFFGLAPIIRHFESQIVTATIMPGSSGSAVLNGDGELSGLVFAGNAQGLSYAYIVPFESVRNFLNNDARILTELGQKERPWLKQDEEPKSEKGNEGPGGGDENGDEGGDEESKQGAKSLEEAKAIFEERCSQKPMENVEIRKLCRIVLK